jgi:hypothetical protein
MRLTGGGTRTTGEAERITGTSLTLLLNLPGIYFLKPFFEIGRVPQSVASVFFSLLHVE